MIDGAVFERMNLISTNLADRRFVKEVLSESDLKKPWLKNGAVDNRLRKIFERGPAVLGLRCAAGLF